MPPEFGMPAKCVCCSETFVQWDVTAMITKCKFCYSTCPVSPKVPCKKGVSDDTFEAYRKKLLEEL